MNSIEMGFPTPLDLEFFCELKVLLGAQILVGNTPKGIRRIIPIIGGEVKGPEINGFIIDGGADWQIVRADGVAELEAHYQFKTTDDVIIYVKNTGIRVATPDVAARIGKGEIVSDLEYYFRVVPQFSSPDGKYGWMNNSIFIGKGIKEPDYVLIQVWKVN